MAEIDERIAALYENSTPEVKILIDRHRAAFYDRDLLQKLEGLPKPLSSEAFVNAVVEATIVRRSLGNAPLR